MKVDLVTFDAADTLVQVFWKPGRFAVECALLHKLAIDEQVAREAYDRLLRSRWTEYRLVNQTRDPEKCDLFWDELTRDWLLGQQIEPDEAVGVLQIARTRLYAPNGEQFKLFDDVIPTVKALRELGIRVAVLSNWDYSLHPILRNLGVYELFDRVFASLEEGPEKPEPELFHIVLDHFSVAPDRALHIGDNPLDDLEGARGVGMHALLLDRARGESSPPFIQSLSEVLAVVE